MEAVSDDRAKDLMRHIQQSISTVKVRRSLKIIYLYVSVGYS